jgi:prepilin signal peptidase PulO-like enzyme (type II secretory pathway)
VAPDHHEVHRVDVGDGIYVRVPAPAAAGPAGPASGNAAPSRDVPPIAVALGAGMAVLALARIGLTTDGLLAAGLLAVLTALAAVDLRARVLPNRILGPAMVGVLLWQLAFSPGGLPEHVVAAVAAGVVLLLPALIQPGAIGIGDVKLVALLGLALGRDVAGALMIGFLAAVPVALAVLVLGGADRRRATLPYGPFLALGAATILLT